MEVTRTFLQTYLLHFWFCHLSFLILFHKNTTHYIIFALVCMFSSPNVYYEVIFVWLCFTFCIYVYSLVTKIFEYCLKNFKTKNFKINSKWSFFPTKIKKPIKDLLTSLWDYVIILLMWEWKEKWREGIKGGIQP